MIYIFAGLAIYCLISTIVAYFLFKSNNETKLILNNALDEIGRLRQEKKDSDKFLLKNAAAHEKANQIVNDIISNKEKKPHEKVNAAINNIPLGLHNTDKDHNS